MLISRQVPRGFLALKWVKRGSPPQKAGKVDSHSARRITMLTLLKAIRHPVKES